MGTLKICVYAICKNEEKFVEKWMSSMKEADEVIVLDTGSTDQTVKKLQDAGATVYIEKISPWRFDVARNRSLDHVPEDTDVCVCTDLDEILLPGWRKKIEACWTKETCQGKYEYNWSVRQDGSPNVQFVYFKIHTRNEFRWKYPVHEILDYIGTRPYNDIFIDGLVLNHYPDPSKSRGSYIGLLELAVKEMPEDDRMHYYLGREYMYSQKWEPCIRTLTEYLKLEGALWREERGAAMRWIAKAYTQMGQPAEAYSWYYRAIGEVPWMRDPYVECARAAYMDQDWNKVLFMSLEALRITKRSETYINEGYAWDATLDDLVAISAYYLGLYELSYKHAKKALEIEPDNERLKNNLAFIESSRK